MPDLPAATNPVGGGRLILVATPIGNLEDLSERGRAALAAADLVACEDTRRSGSLLKRLGLDKRPLISLHDHNESQRLPGLLRRLNNGETVALVSDAGTPLLSDPGFKLVRAAIAEEVRVEAIPGPAAPVLALVLSGLPPLPFTFAGFVPARRGQRRRFYDKFADLGHTLIVFESPHRLVASLSDAAEALGARSAAVAREMTKLHEEVVRGSLPELAAAFAARQAIKGEITVVIGGAD